MVFPYGNVRVTEFLYGGLRLPANVPAETSRNFIAFWNLAWEVTSFLSIRGYQGSQPILQRRG